MYKLRDISVASHRIITWLTIVSNFRLFSWHHSPWWRALASDKPLGGGCGSPWISRKSKSPQESITLCFFPSPTFPGLVKSTRHLREQGQLLTIYTYRNIFQRDSFGKEGQGHTSGSLQHERLMSQKSWAYGRQSFFIISVHPALPASILSP